MSSLTSNLDTLQVIISSLLEQFGKGTKTSNGLQSLLEATQSVHITILQPAFRNRSDATRILKQVGDVITLAFENLQELQFLIDPGRDRGKNRRSPQSESDETVRNQAIFSNLSKHATQFQKIIDYANGREDWSRLAPKAPRAPSASPSSSERIRLQPTTQLDPGRMSISTPPSPYATTIEDVEDTDTEVSDAKANPNIQQVHYVRKDESPITPTDGKAGGSLGKAFRRSGAPQTPPQVVIRQATDPKQFSDSPPQPKRPSEVSASPLRTAAGAEDFFIDSDDEKPSPPEPKLKASALPKLLTKQERPSQSVSDIQAEIDRLQSQLDKFKVGASSGSDSGRPIESARPLDSARPEGKRRTSGKHHSVDLGHGSRDTLETPQSRRPRASTGHMGERPKSFVESSSYDPYRSEMPPPPRPADKLKRTGSQRSARGPSRSPHITPYSAFERSDNYWDYNSPQVPQSAADIYGSDPRHSLPTLVERDNRPSRLGRRPKRDSNQFGDDGNFGDYFRDESGAADFSLFGPPSVGQSTSRPPPRSRGNSRAQDTSPNSKPYISPRQLHDSVDLEPDVREISVSLEDVFFGVVKKFRVKRNKFDDRTGIVTQDERVLEVPISRGLKPKSKIKFEGEGHQTAEGTRELHFQLTEKPHPIFTRQDYDLHLTLEITLSESLCGWERTITSIDGKDVRFSHPGPTPSNWKDDKPGLGMCLFKNPEMRGDLIAGVIIKMPSLQLSDAQKRLIRQALAMGNERSPRGSGNFF